MAEEDCENCPFLDLITCDQASLIKKCKGRLIAGYRFK